MASADQILTTGPTGMSVTGQGEIAHRWMFGSRLVSREALGQIHALIHPAAIDVQQRHGNGMQQHYTP